MSPTKKQNNKLTTQRLVVVSNRLPIVLTKVDTGQWQVRPSIGGLVTALAPLLREREGIWIGWTGTLDDIDELVTAKIQPIPGIDRTLTCLAI